MDAAELVPAAAVEAEVGEGVGGGVEWHCEEGVGLFADVNIVELQN